MLMVAHRKGVTETAGQPDSAAEFPSAKAMPGYAICKESAELSRGPGGRAMAATNGDGRERVVRVGALADLHCSKNSQGQLQPLLLQAAAEVDLLLLGGDLTDYGLPEEAHILVRELSGVKVPM